MNPFPTPNKVISDPLFVPRRRSTIGALNFIEHFDRCPECAAATVRAYRTASAPLDRARDAGLMRRDVNEALETISLEALS
jgi:hypothetical protein